MARVLEGTKVIEFDTFITGPYTGMLLADLGADVVKVEQPGGGDPFRGYTGTHYRHNFHTYNARKGGVSLNLKSPAAREVLESLLSQADTHDLIRFAKISIQRRAQCGSDR